VRHAVGSHRDEATELLRRDETRDLLGRDLGIVVVEDPARFASATIRQKY
jgi:hypothetical protein